MRVLTVVGARPQFIKAAVVSHKIAARDGISETLVHTGQHFDDNMSKVFFTELGIPLPDHNLGVSGGSHGAMTGRMLEALEAVIVEERPDWVLVYGDTNSTLAGALAASKLHVPIAHVEAGLRSFNKQMPEEINRILTDHCSDLLLTPTSVATCNLGNEGIDAARIVQIGDVMYDAALAFAARTKGAASVPARLGLAPEGYVLATLHRQENTDDPARLRTIMDALARVAESVPVVLPLHPRTFKTLDREGLGGGAPGLHLIEPIGYLDMVALEKGAAAIATDSGGVQKEAYFHSVPCVTLRDETEWVELVDTGWNRLSPPVAGSVRIAEAILSVIGTRGEATGLYGSGDASVRLVDALLAR